MIADDRSGARARKLKWYKILVIAALSSIAAVIFIFPHHNAVSA